MQDRVNASAPSQTLELFEADLLDDGAFDDAVRDCSVCFHTASPFWMDDRITDPQAQLVEPAERGTLNVLRSCAKAAAARTGDRLERVVLTSSFAALMNTDNPPDHRYDEAEWNTSSAPGAADGAFPEPANAHAYRWSKTVAERSAWEFVRGLGGGDSAAMTLACINPPMVLGVNKQQLAGSAANLNQSSLIVHNLLSGNAKEVMPGSVGFTDAADVAKAHILAAQTPGAAGQRYLCSGTTATWATVADVLRRLYPSMPIPANNNDPEQPCLDLANDKIRAELGMQFEPLDVTLKRQGDALISAGLL